MLTRDWFRHAFDLGPAPTVAPNDVQRAVVDRLAREVVRRRLTTPALLALEACSPLNFVSAQALYYFQPFVSSFADASAYLDPARVRVILATDCGSTTTKAILIQVVDGAYRLEGLYDEPRVGAPRTISDNGVEAVIVKTLETTPKGETHSSTRTMAAKAGMSHTMIGRIWRTFGLKPHVTGCGM